MNRNITFSDAKHVKDIFLFQDPNYIAIISTKKDRVTPVSRPQPLLKIKTTFFDLQRFPALFYSSKIIFKLPQIFPKLSSLDRNNSAVVKFRISSAIRQFLRLKLELFLQMDYSFI